jgi:hypothetical protein
MQRRKKPSSLLVEQDVQDAQSKADAIREMDACDIRDILLNGDWDFSTGEQDYYLCGLAMRNSTSPSRDRTQAALEQSMADIYTTPNSHVAPVRTQDTPPTADLKPMIRYLGDHSGDKYAVLSLNGSQSVQWSQYTDTNGRPNY